MDSICLRTGIHGISPTIAGSSNLEARPNTSKISAGAVAGRPAPAAAVAVAVAAGGTGVEKEKGGGVLRTALWRFSFRYPFRSLFTWARRGMGIKGVALEDAALVEGKESKQDNGAGEEKKVERGGENGDRNWVLKVLPVKSLWGEQGNGEEELDERAKGENGEPDGHKNGSSSSSASRSCGDEQDGVCEAGYNEYNDDEQNEIVFDRNSFSKLLRKVSLSDAKLYAQMSYLGDLAYAIPSIKRGNRLKGHGLRYVTSSIEKREQLVSADKKEQFINADSGQPSNIMEEQEIDPLEAVELETDKNEEPQTSASAVFRIAVSAASYLNSRARSIFGSPKADVGQEILEDFEGRGENVGEMASFMAASDSVTAVVAAEEEAKQAVADDLSSVRSSPCEWYICDDDQSATRFFVIQGSETLASWQANLLFEPIQFEGLDTFVHRGIYEAAKGMYQQILPEIQAHMKAHGRRARLRFTGHSLGGSLSLLINLMLLIRGVVPLASLLPVITFGSPTIMCGGDELLRKLGLPRSHIQAITMHRDIVPRAFSCHYPNHVAELLKAVNGNFRNHPCLNNQKLLYAPMGELIILQPDGNYSPQHDLLPSGSGLYLLTSPYSDANDAEKLLRAAKLVFLNSPHPLEILGDRSAYGNRGTIQRDHEMDSYLKCVRSVIRHELSQLRKAKRERSRKVRWLIHGAGGIVRTGSESLKRLTRLVTSQHTHLLVLLLFPARLLLIGAYSVIEGFRLR